MENRKNNKGQMTLEIVVALAILTVSIAGLTVLIGGGESLSLDSSQSDKALALGQEALMEMKTLGESNFTSIQSTSTVQNGFNINIAVTSPDNFTKIISEDIKWQTDPLRQQSLRLQTLVTDLVSANNLGGDTGGGGITGSCSNPQTLGSIDLGPGEQATDIDVVGKTAYLSSVASDSKKPDFFAVDVSNPQSPQILGSLNSSGEGLNALDATSRYVYAANNDDSSQLQIIDISNPANPVLVKSFQLPGSSGSGKSVYFYGNKVYVGTTKSGGPEFHIVDVSNPSSPAELGSLKIGADVNAIKVFNNKAYLATSDDSKELQVLDVSNPGSISSIGYFNAPGSDDASSVYVSGNIVYLGRASGSNTFLILDATNPANIIQLSDTPISGAVNGITVTNNLAFLATSDSNREFQAWNVSNPSSPWLCTYLNFPQVGTGVDYDSNNVYSSVRSNDALRIITFSP